MSRNWHHKHVSGGISIGEEWSYTRRVTMINPTERAHHRHAYVLWFGAYGWTRLHVFADCLEDALEECAAWLADYAPGLIMPMYGNEHMTLIREVCAERGLDVTMLTDEQQWEVSDAATVDMTHTESGYIAAWEWGIGLEDPSSADLYSYVKGE